MGKESPAQDLWREFSRWKVNKKDKSRSEVIIWRTRHSHGHKKSQRLRWLGHVERMPEDRLPKMVMRRTIGGRRRRGRPRSRWWREIRRDLERARINGWGDKAANRGEWRSGEEQSIKPWTF